MSVNIKMTAIADAIRKYTECSEKLTLDQMAESIPVVYASGSKDWEDAFWAMNQANGDRTYYNGAFAEWEESWIRPQYELYVEEGHKMFQYAQIGDLEALIYNLGRKLGFPEGEEYLALNLEYCLNASFMFSESSVTKIGKLFPASAVSASTLRKNPCDLSGMFERCTNLKTIAELHLYEKANYIFADTFYRCTALEHLLITGCIQNEGFDVGRSTNLNKASIISIINCLSDDTSGLAVTISTEAVAKAFATESGATNGTDSTEWLSLMATKPNWTINLI